MTLQGGQQFPLGHIPELEGVIALPEARVLPSGLKATAVTGLLWPSKVVSSF